MATLAHLITLIGVGSIASSVVADEQQNQNKTQNGGGSLKHLLGSDVFTELRDKQNAMAEKMSGIEAKLEKQIENGMRETQTLLSTKLENQIENVFTELRNNHQGLTTKIENGMRDSQNLLSNKLENGMRENQNALAKKVSETEAKLENQIGKAFTELRDNQNGLSTKLENGIQNNQKALSLMKNMATLALFHFPIPIYRWNASDCDPEIVINESTNAIQRNGTDIDWRSCRAWPIHMPSAAGRIGIIYAEYRILNNGLLLSIGLSTKEMPLDHWVGDGRVSYGYADYGQIKSTNTNGNRAVISENVPSFGTGDVVGCGLNWATRQLFFTKNGQRLNITNLYVDEGTADLYPTVTLFDHLAAVEANFGPNFKYDLSQEF